MSIFKKKKPAPQRVVEEPVEDLSVGEVESYEVPVETSLPDFKKKALWILESYNFSRDLSVFHAGNHSWRVNRETPNNPPQLVADFNGSEDAYLFRSSLLLLEITLEEVLRDTYYLTREDLSLLSTSGDSTLRLLFGKIRAVENALSLPLEAIKGL